MKFDKEYFANRIQIKRKVFSINLRSAGKQTKTSAATLSRLERGATPEIETFLRVCDWLGNRPMEFIK